MPGDPTPQTSEENIARVAKIVIESGIASKLDVQTCLKALQDIRRVGVQHTLLRVMVDKGILTANQARAVQAAAETGDASGLLGGYQLLEQLGAGGMGTVYKAKQLSLDRLVAIKILPANLAEDAEFVARFEREAQTAAKINHQNIVSAIDFGAAAGKRYFAMEYVEGRTIGEILDEEGRIPESRALEIVSQMVRALDAAWQNNLVHRDIKPDNILIMPDGIAKLADLGLAKEVSSRDSDLTMAGSILGTPNYVSPEQASGEEVDIRTDIYSLGATLYHMVTGQTPFTGENPSEVIMARFKTLPPLANEVNPALSPQLTAVIEVMMAVDPDDRYLDPRVLLHDLLLVASGDDPEFAGGSDTKRMRAIEAAKSLPAETGMALRAVRRRRTRFQTVTILTALGAAVVAALVVGSWIRSTVLSGPAGDRPGPAGRVVTEEDVEAAAQEVKGLIEKEEFLEAIDRAEQLAMRLADGPGVEQLDELRNEARRKHNAAQAALVDEAARELSELVEDKEYDRAINLAVKYSAKFKDAPGIEKIETLRLNATSKRDEERRLREEERHRAEEERRRAEEQERRYKSLIQEAKREIAAEDYATALAFLAQARGIKETEEVEQLADKARRIQFISRGGNAERRNDLAQAIDMYKQALEIEEDAELTARVKALEERQQLAQLCGDADRLLAAGDWSAARDTYEKALELAANDEKEAIRKKIAGCSEELAFLDVLKSARKAAEGENWRQVLSLTDKALEMKPADPRAAALRKKARTALGPEKTIVNSIGMEFVLIPAGEFTMGSSKGDADEKPEHKVRLDAFYVSRTEVTNAQFEQFMPAHREKWRKYSPADDMPVIAVTWDEAAAFCKWLSLKEGVECRLPTEAEWEKAARGSDARVYPWGNDAPASRGEHRCNHAPAKAPEQWKKDGFEFAAPVGSFPNGASPFGCFDMAGNVWEWCLDFYSAGWYSDEGRGKENPAGPAAGTKRALRGGSFNDSARILRSANRLGKPQSLYDANVGFRCVRALDLSQ